MVHRFEGSFTQQEPIPEAAVDAATAVLNHGRLHRYNLAEDEVGEASLLEREFAAFTGARYVLAMASGGQALAAALRAYDVRPGDAVLSNAFTLAPVPGAIAGVGARVVFVETTESLTIDFAHLEEMAEVSGARVLMLSHMRGHEPDFDWVMRIARDLGIVVIVDCEHTMGGSWRGVASGRHGAAACYSTQTYKHINSGEGGLLATDDPEVAARATLLSGSYMLYERHGAGPDADVFEAIRDFTPNLSGRMDNLRAAILRPQLAALPARVKRWADLHDAMEDGLRDLPRLSLIDRHPDLVRVGSSFQFRLPDHEANEIEALLDRCARRGVELKWFGAARAHGFTSTYRHWAYADSPALPQTDQVTAGLLDMRLPLTFSKEDCEVIARIIREEVSGKRR
ncbi:MAG: aminotransferase class I/II-fold pyridoxal phosphate-dependent enzyme [Boseongicola sp.]|nr:aminotransferase class I/II-fold pyridoxal phosphate-dependent enzyme [Boseongicola sp.]